VSWGLAWIRSATQPARLSALKALGPPLLMRPTQTCALPHPGQCLAGIQWIEWRVGRKGVGVGVSDEQWCELPRRARRQ
jgi:hypothetical protein